MRATGETLLFEIYDSGDDCIARTQADIHQGTASIRLENPHLWNGVEDPYLYKACAKLLEGGTELDAVCARFGVRTFEVHPDTGFSLNGGPIRCTVFPAIRIGWIRDGRLAKGSMRRI